MYHQSQRTFAAAFLPRRELCGIFVRVQVFDTMPVAEKGR
jgi:hypothetical protein